MKIIQQTNKTSSQMTGYVLVAKTGEVLVIDGGERGDKDELARIVKSLGGHIDLWLITHPHCDHHNAIMELISDPDGITYDRLGASQVSDDWARLAGSSDIHEVFEWNAFARENLDERYFDLEKGMVFELGSMKIEVLAVANPELLMNPINNQSVVLRITEGDFVFLVLGDLGVEGGEKCLASGVDVRADGVQMAHHGQHGVNEAFYKAVAPKYAFWSTPDWLWFNRDANGEDGKGPFATQIVAGWMEKLGTENIIDFENSVVFDTETRKTEKY